MTCGPSRFLASLCSGMLAISACEKQRDEAQRTANVSVAAPGASGALQARAIITGPPNSGIKGEVKLVELRGNFPEPGVQINARITGSTAELAPGPHGLHIHENAMGGCVPPYTSAGGHFDPGPAGNADPDVNHPYHMGDVPNLIVDSSGEGSFQAVTSRITLSPGPLSVLDKNGSVIVLHGEADQGVSGPAKSGVSGGPRIACGLIERIPDSVGEQVQMP
jgi:superoxide dismutase, Cu-Zn family